MSKLAVLIPLLSLAACGGGDGSHADYSHCTGGPTTLTVTNADVIEGPNIVLPSGLETDIGLQATDAAGNLCDPSDLELRFDDAGLIDVVDVGETTVLKPRVDALDRGTEPTTVMHASLGSLEASWTVVSVLGLGGPWIATVSEDTAYPDGFEFGKIVLTQRGHALSWEQPDCTIPQACGVALTIAGVGVTADIPDVNLKVNLIIARDRQSFSGTWSTDNYAGTFNGKRP